GDALVEAVHKLHEGLMAAHGLVEALLAECLGGGVHSRVRLSGVEGGEQPPGDAPRRRRRQRFAASTKRGIAKGMSFAAKPARMRARSSRSTPHCRPGGVCTVMRRW